MANNQKKDRVEAYNDALNRTREMIEKFKIAVKELNEEIKNIKNNPGLSDEEKRQAVKVKRASAEGQKSQIKKYTDALEKLRNGMLEKKKDVKTVYLYERGNALAEDIEKLSNKKVDLEQIPKIAKDDKMKKAIINVWKKYAAIRTARGTFDRATLRKMGGEFRNSVKELENAYKTYNGPKQQDESEFTETVLRIMPDAITDWENVNFAEICSAEAQKIDQKINNRKEKLEQVYNDGIENGALFREFEGNLPTRPPAVIDKKPFWPWGRARREWKARQKQAREWEKKKSEAKEYGSRINGYSSFRNKLKSDIDNYVREFKKKDKEDDKAARNQGQDNDDNNDQVL